MIFLRKQFTDNLFISNVVRKLVIMKKKKNNKAQALIEFALVFPIFIFLIFAIVDFGRAFYQHTLLNRACKEAVRTAVVTQPPINANLIAQNAVTFYNQRKFCGADVTPANITVRIPGVGGVPGDLSTDPITVQATRQFQTTIFDRLIGALAIHGAAAGFHEFFNINTVALSTPGVIPVVPVPVPEDWVKDTDGGGISDAWEKRFATNPKDAVDDSLYKNRDTDGDGISDWDEIKGTSGQTSDPRYKDSDGDGIDDGKDPYPRDPNRPIPRGDRPE
jgi:hypothetical protein